MDRLAPFPAADSLPSGYSRAQDAIDQLGAAGVVKLTLVYQAPEAEHPDPPGEAFAPGCVQADRILTVNSTGDDEDGDISDGICDTGNARRGFTGSCTLRAALQEADQTNELDVIEFKIPGSGVPTIHIDHDKAFGFGSHGYLRPVIIDGFTQDAGMVEIDGSAAPSVDIAGNEIVGLDIVGTRGVVRGLVINRFPSDGIRSGRPVRRRSPRTTSSATI